MESQPQNPEFRNNPESFHPRYLDTRTQFFYLLTLQQVASHLYQIEPSRKNLDKYSCFQIAV